MACAYLTAQMLCRPYAQGMIVAHVDDAAIKLLRKLRFMLDQLPEELRPYLKSDRREEITLRGIACLDGEVQLNTAAYVGSATGDEIWRGLTLQMAHLSEAAYFPRPEETFIGIMQSVPVTPQSTVVLESTARGLGNFFHDEWVRAEANDSDFAPVFIAWWESPEARMLVPKDFQLEPEERDLKRALALTNEQLQWRRYILYTACHGDRDLFAQEHPSSPGEAFLMSGRPAFPLPVLREMYDRAQKLTPLRKRAGTYPAQGLIGEEGKFAALERGPFTIYRPPHPDHEYVVGIDVAAGVEGGDYSCAQVFDRTAEEQVAVWHGHLTPVQFARVCVGIGRLYQQAWLVPEVTGGWGYTVVEELKAVQYQRIYQWTRIDRVRQIMSNYYGWETSMRTRPLLINGLANALIEKTILMVDLPTITEAMEFQDTGKRYEGLKRDDLIMAFMIAYRVHLEYPLDSTGIPPHIRYPDEHGEAVHSGPPPPSRAFDREVWEETDKALKEMERGATNTAAQYGLADTGEDAGPTDHDWLSWGV